MPGMLPAAFGKTWAQAQNSWNLLKSRLEGDLAPVSTPPTTDLFIGRRILLTTTSGGWELVYIGGAYPWLFVGGSPLNHEITTNSTRASSTYGDLAAGAVGPEVTIPRRGIYDVYISARLWNGATAQDMYMSYAIGETAAADADAINWWATGNIANYPGSRKRRKEFTANGLKLVGKYRSTSAGSFELGHRFLEAIPVRIA